MDIVREKEFIALSAEERTELSDICSNEDEFNNLKHVFLNVEAVAASSIVAPKMETKKELDELFVSTYPKASGVWYSSILAVVTPKDKPIYRQPLVQLAAVGLLVFLMVPFLNNASVNTTDKELLASDDTEEVMNIESSSLNEMESDELNIDDSSNEYKNKEIETKTEQNGGTVEWMASVPSDDQPLSFSRDKSTTSGSEVLNDHPDGVFAEEEAEISYSIPTSEQPELLDLLTTTF